MDKLQPILKFHFWILLFIALIMAFVGWWMTTGQMKASITARRSTIEEKKNKIPKDASNHPNQTWDDQLAAINAEQDKLIRFSKAWLYTRQKEAMVWPSWLPEPAHKMKNAEDAMDNQYRVIYRNNYIKEVMRVYEIPKPIQDPQDPNGVVIFPFGVMPHRDWGDVTPTSKQVWESMEDLWLLEPILRAVYDTNGGEAGTRQEASVVQIEYVKLHGGDRSKIGQSIDASGGGGGGGAMPAMAGGFGMGAMEMKAGELGGGGGGVSQTGPSIDTDVKPVDEFGDPGAGDAGGGGGGGDMDVVGGPAGMLGAGGDPSRFGGGSSNLNEETGRRYIDDDEKQPFKTRGFKLTVVMDHRKVPDLYGHLTSSERSPWPIKIVRMNIADFKEGGSFSGGGFGGGFRGGGGDKDDAPVFVGARPGGSGPPAFGGSGNLPGAPGLQGGRPGIPRAGVGIGRGDREFDSGLGTSPTPQDNPLERPYLARVTILGLITMYKEPPQVEGTPSTGAQPGDAVATEPSSAADASADGTAELSTDDEAADLSAPSSVEDADEVMPAEESAHDPKPVGDAEDEAATEDAEMKDDEGKAKSDDEATPADDPAGEAPPEESGAADESSPPGEPPESK